jgi:hypothetical protein
MAVYDQESSEGSAGNDHALSALYGTSCSTANNRNHQSDTVQNQQHQQWNGPALASDDERSTRSPFFSRLETKGSQVMNHSTQQVAASLKKGAEWNKAATEQVNLAFHRSRSKVTTVLSKSQTTICTAIRNITAGSHVSTAYGAGKIVAYDAATLMYQVQLSFGTLFTPNVVAKSKANQKKLSSTLELNSAYEGWEQARRHLIEEECSKLGIPFTEKSMNTCLSCLKEPEKKAKPALADSSGKPLFPMLYKLRQTSQDAVVNARKTESPCLVCGTVTCKRHSSEAFRKEGISVCQDCIKWLEYDFASARLATEVHQYVQHLVDLYQRAHLLLQYSSKFMLATADALEQTTKQHNHIGIGGSGAGMVSSVLGIAAACTILTPAGPPLLVASLVFGGSATAIQTGSEAYMNYGEPSQVANRILTLQGIAERILAVVQTMRDSKLLPYLDQATASENDKANHCTAYGSQRVHHVTDMKESAAIAGVRIGSNAATSASLLTQEATLTSRFVSRATTSAARTARFARFAGGALSAATLVLEGREMLKTLDQIKLGSPCEKAAALRHVHANLSNMPSTMYVKTMCESYSKVVSKELLQATVADSNTSLEFVANVVPTGVVTDDMTVESSAAASAATEPVNRTVGQDEDDLFLAEELVAGLEAAHDAGSPPGSVSSTSNHMSLLERVKRFKQREAEKGR